MFYPLFSLHQFSLTVDLKSPHFSFPLVAYSLITHLLLNSRQRRHGQGRRPHLFRGAHPRTGEGGGGGQAEDAAQGAQTAAQEPRVLPGERRSRQFDGVHSGTLSLNSLCVWSPAEIPGRAARPRPAPLHVGLDGDVPGAELGHPLRQHAGPAGSVVVPPLRLGWFEEFLLP